MIQWLSPYSPGPVHPTPDYEAASGAVLRAEGALIRVLSLIVFSSYAAQLSLLVAEWPHIQLGVVAFTAPAVGFAFGIWLLVRLRGLPSSAEHETRQRAVAGAEVFIAAIAVSGVFLEAVVLPPSIVASMNNAGYVALAICAYAAGVYLPVRSSLPLILLITMAHVFVLRSAPTEGWQGGLQLASIWGATRLIAVEVRRAGRAAEDACVAAREAEREEASARVHDALGLLRVVARGGASAGLAQAAEETKRRTAEWLAGASTAGDLVGVIQRVAGQFPDLAITLRLADTLSVHDPAVATVVGRAVHTLLGNVREHARASRVEVTALRLTSGWVVTVRDDGCGFDVASTRPRGGLVRFTRKALAEVGVEMRVQSRLGLGTVVTLHGPAGAGRTGSPGRFASWHGRPGGGLARAEWIADIGQAALVASYTVMVLAGFGHLLHHNGRPVVSGGLVIFGTSLLGVVWLRGRHLSRIAIGMSMAATVLAGAVVTALDGPDAASGDKLGIMLMAWACVLLAAARPDLRWLAVGLAFVPLLVLWRVDIVAGAISALYAALACLVAAWLISALAELGFQADADRDRVIAMERAAVAPLLFRHAAVIHAADGRATVERAATEDLLALVEQAEGYVKPPRIAGLSTALHNGLTALPHIQDRLDLDTRHLNCDPGSVTIGLIVETVAALVAASADAAPTGCISVRGVGETDDWQLAVLSDLGVPGSGPNRPAVSTTVRNALMAAGIELSSQELLGSHRYVLRRTAAPGIASKKPL